MQTAIDATIVRAMLVPSLMALLGTLNWAAPRWLRNREPTPPLVNTGPSAGVASTSHALEPLSGDAVTEKIPVLAMAARARIEVLVGFILREPRHAPFDAHLALQLRPVEHRRGAWILCELAALAAEIRGKEPQTTPVEAA